MSLEIHSIATANPRYQGDQQQALAMAQRMCAETERHDDTLHAIYNHSGIDNRHTVLWELTGDSNGSSPPTFRIPQRGNGDPGPTMGERMERYEKEAPPLAIDAVRGALEQTDVPTDALTHLVTVSCTGFASPGYDIALINQLGLPRSISRTQVGFMGCHAALNAIRVARGYAESDANARVLVCAAELCTLHLHYGWDAGKMVANALFADGAAAFVAGGQAGPSDALRVVDNASIVLPDSEEMMTWRIRDHGFEMTLAPDLPQTIHAHLETWLRQWLGSHDLTVAEIGSWAIHPGGPKIVLSVVEALGLSLDSVAASREVLANCGNMSSPTLLFILQRLQARQAPRPIVAIGFGPGLTIEAALIR